MVGYVGLNGVLHAGDAGAGVDSDCGEVNTGGRVG
jgi:hypothetical protein